MSYITRTGNLAETPTLREGDNGPYTYARVLVSDRLRQGRQLHRRPDHRLRRRRERQPGCEPHRGGRAQRYIRVTFSGRYRVTEYKGEQGTRGLRCAPTR